MKTLQKNRNRIIILTLIILPLLLVSCADDPLVAELIITTTSNPATTYSSGTMIPAAHASSHSDGGSDEVDITNLGGYSGTGTEYLNGSGSWSTPAGSGDMTSAVYDTNDDGTVDSADTATTASSASSADSVALGNVTGFTGSSNETVMGDGTIDSLNTGRGATYVVAGSNAPDHVKAQADYLCDGTADDVEIQAAYDACSSGDSIRLFGSANITTQLNFNSTGITFTGPGQLNAWSDITVINLTGSWNTIRDITFWTPSSSITSTAILIGDAQRLEISDCVFYRQNYCIRRTSTNYTWDIDILNNQFYDGDRGVDLGYVEILHIDGNTFELFNKYALILQNSGIQEYVTNNHFDQNYTDATADGDWWRAAIYIHAQKNLLLEGNTFQSNKACDIYVSGGRNLDFTDNNHYRSCQLNTVSTKVIYVTSATPNTVTITDCTIYDDGTPKYRTGIGSDVAINLYNNDITGAVTNNIAVAVGSKVINNRGYIASGESRFVSGLLTAGVTNATCFYWHNVEYQDIYITKIVIDVTTSGGTGSSTLQVGIADDSSGTNLGTEFFNTCDLYGTGLSDSWNATDNGTMDHFVFCDDSASATNGYVFAKILTANASSLVGRYYIWYVGK